MRKIVKFSLLIGFSYLVFSPHIPEAVWEAGSRHANDKETSLGPSHTKNAAPDISKGRGSE